MQNLLVVSILELKLSQKQIWVLLYMITIVKSKTQANFQNLQRTFARYTERTAFERPLTSGVAYAVRVLHSEREQFEKQQGWTIKRMDTLEQNPVHKDYYTPELLEPSPIQEEYAPVIFAQDTISHVVSLDMLSGKVSSFVCSGCFLCSIPKLHLQI